MQECTQCDMDVYAALDLETMSLDEGQAGYRKICIDVDEKAVFLHA